MEYGSNVRKVEKAMKDALKNDRARIQVGRISGFGLMEMSRQRLRTGVLEASTRTCPHCDGTGLVRTASSAGLSALRLIEDEAAKGKGSKISLYASTEAAVYLLNAKRADLREIEERYGVEVEVLPEGEDEGAKMRVASSGPRPTVVPRFEPIAEEVEDDFVDEEPEDEEFDDEEREETERAPRGERGEDDRPRNKRRRRRRGGRGRDREDGDRAERDEDGEGSTESEDGDDEGEERSAETSEDTGEERPRKRRRRGGRRRRRGAGEGEAVSETAGFEGAEAAEAIAEEALADVEVPAGAEEPVAEEAPKPKRSRKKAAPAEEAVAEAAPAEPEAEAPAKPKRSRKKAEPVAEAEAAPAEPEAEAPAKPKRSRKKAVAAEEAEPALAEAANDANGDEADGEPRRGWWQRTFGN